MQYYQATIHLMHKFKINKELSVNQEAEIINLLIQALKMAGFEIIEIENDMISVQPACEEISDASDNKPPNSSQSIFPSIPRLGEVFEFIELNYHHPIRLKEVAQAVGYSSAYLTDLVRRMTGKTVNDWIIGRRLAEARRLLLETEAPIEQIASKIGYQNINHFYCQFRNYHQKTPRVWREVHRS